MTTTATDPTTVIREEIKNLLSAAGAFCGQCGFEPGDRGTCPDCERVWDSYADALMPLLDAVGAGALAAAAEKLLGLADETEARVADYYGTASGIGPGPADMLRMAARTVASMTPATARRPGPQRVVICGSTRYTADMTAIAQRLTWDGIDVFAPIMCDLKSQNPLWDDPAEKAAGAARLAALHNAKIREADLVLVVGPHDGDSTRGEIVYAKALGKPVRFTDPALAAKFDAEVWEPETAATA